MRTFIQDPDEVRLYTVDWQTFLASQATTPPTISSVEYIIPSELNLDNSSDDGVRFTTTLLRVISVTTGTYTCAHRVTLSDSQVVEWPFKVRVKSNNEG